MTCCCGAVASGVIAYIPNTVFSVEGITNLVANAGGNVNALFRGSLAWDSWSDVDFHLHEPQGGHIYFSNKVSFTGGELDVDMNIGSQVLSSNSNKFSKPAVENIMYTDLAKMPDGDYKFSFVQYGVDNTRAEGADMPYLLIENRTPDEAPRSHYVLLKRNGTNNPNNTAVEHELATVRKTGNNFKLVALGPNTVILENHNFDIGTFTVQGHRGNSATEGAVTSGTNPVGQ